MISESEHASPVEQINLPSELLQAISAPGGGRIALVVGAGCSVERPTSIPTSGTWSKDLHRRLVADGILTDGECPNPDDLSCVADVVFSKTNSQKEIVDRVLDLYDLKVATPNEGHLIAAAMLCENAVSSVVTLNYDLALTNALSQIGTRDNVSIIECPEHLTRQRAVNLYYLHRNANEADPDKWVLRTSALESEWQGHWEEIITTKVLTAPVVVFAGLGTPVAVLIKSVKLIQSALPSTTKLYQADPADQAGSKFFQELELDSSAYIQQGWCQFMEELSQRLSTEQISKLEEAVNQLVQENQLTSEDISGFLESLRSFGLIKLGVLRAYWLLHCRPYFPLESSASRLMADLLLALGMLSRLSGSDVIIVEDGIVEFSRGGQIVATYLIASGSGYLNKVAVEAKVASRRKQFKSRKIPPRGLIVGGTSDSWNTFPTPPKDVVRGDASEGDLISGPTEFPMFHIDELRGNPELVGQVVP